MNEVFLTRCDPGPGTGPLVAVKDLIDVVGIVTTAGCRAIAEQAQPAARDADCVASIRAGGARIVGKTALNELAAGANGVNAWYGTPPNPLDSRLVPGGSSSGSAVAVATGEAEWALGTDTGGSIRVPAACCGIAGLKTTPGRVSTAGVLPLAPSLDSVGPLARDVSGLVTAMELLEPGFAISRQPVSQVARLRGLPEEAAIAVAIDAALRAAGIECLVVTLDGWQHAAETNRWVILTEAAVAHEALLRRDPDGVSAPIRSAFAEGAALTRPQRAELTRSRIAWRAQIGAVLGHCPVLVLPTLLGPPPPLGLPATPGSPLVAATAPVNLAGLPALSLPVPWPVGVVAPSRAPASLQLVGAGGSEELLLGAGLLIERATDRTGD